MASDVRSKGEWFSPPQARQAVRFCQVRSLNTASPGVFSTAGASVAEVFKFGRLEAFVRDNTEVLPTALGQRHPRALVSGKRLSEPVEVQFHELLVDVPGGHLLSVRTFDVPVDVRDATSRSQLVQLMEDAYYEELELCPPLSEDERKQQHTGIPQSVTDSAEWIHEQLSEVLVEERLAEVHARLSQASDYHQLVFVPFAEGSGLEFDHFQRIIYRAELEAVKKYCDIRRPPELNRRPERGAALGPFVSVLWGQQDYIENCALLSALLLVSAISTAGGVRDRTHAEIRRLHSDVEDRAPEDRSLVASRREFRARLESLTEQSRQEDVRLTFAVEGNASIQSVIPSLRVDSYHQSLYQAMGLQRELDVLRNLISRLNHSIDAQFRTLESYEQALAQSRQRRWGIVAGFVTVVLAPISVFLAFFGINSPEIKADQSIFSLSTYLGVYLGILGLMVLCFAIYLALGIRDHRAIRAARAEYGNE